MLRTWATALLGLAIGLGLALTEQNLLARLGGSAIAIGSATVVSFLVWGLLHDPVRESRGTEAQDR
jgi:hypothetical protein